MCRIFAILVLFSIAFPAVAEVSDKTPSPSALWAVCGVAGLISLGAAAFRPWLGALGVAYSLLSLIVSHSELTDPYVGPAIVAELGESYALSAYAAPVLTLTMSAIGIIIGLRRGHARKVPAG